DADATLGELHRAAGGTAATDEAGELSLLAPHDALRTAVVALRALAEVHIKKSAVRQVAAVTALLAPARQGGGELRARRRLTFTRHTQHQRVHPLTETDQQDVVARRRRLKCGGEHEQRVRRAAVTAVLAQCVRQLRLVEPEAAQQ